ncbi:DUF3293 domain-containing protein [Vibrio sp. HN007]|uniref:DUF3293 domain-containing protein n=1 Tax=Vibrio iocasae TaxID=3098914 RepID=UPI0035D4CEBD
MMNIKPSLLEKYKSVYFFLNNEIAAIEFAIITAWNPFSKPVSYNDNRQKNFHLECEILKQNYEKLLVGDINKEWTEESFAVEMSLDEAVELGIKYEQNAIYYVRSDNVYLVSCIDEQKVENEIALFSQRTKYHDSVIDLRRN